MIKFLVNVIGRALSFSKVESRGVLVLIFVIIASFIFSRIYISQLKEQQIADPKDAAQLEAWITEVEASFEVKKEESNYDKSAYLPITREFVKKEELKKEPLKLRQVIPEKAKNEAIIIADLNEASAEELQKVKGIGPTFSNRIIKFREKLGGFATNSQLNEVYGLAPETVAEVEKYFSVQSPPQPFDINNDSAKVLAAHPYVSYDQAWVIIKYRRQNGDIANLTDLKKIKAIDQKTIDRLKPYLD